MAWSCLVGEELRVVLLGNVGSGKSASGNTLLGTSHFDCKLSASPVTQQCEAKPERIRVVDTPGLTAEMVSDTKEKLLQCLQLSAPGPHVFLLVIPLGRFTQEEKDTVQRAAQLFKEHFYTFTIILFTFKDNLKNDSISNYISTAGESLQQLLQKCGNRYHAFNNNNPTEDDQAEQLLRKMNRLVQDNFRTYYTLDDRKREERMRRASSPPAIYRQVGSPIVIPPPVISSIGLSLSGLFDFEREERRRRVPLSARAHSARAHSVHFFGLFDFVRVFEPDLSVDLKEEFEKLKIRGSTEENLKKQAEILDKWKEQLESKEKRLKDREEQVRKQEEELEEKKKKLKEHLPELSDNL